MGRVKISRQTGHVKDDSSSSFSLLRDSRVEEADEVDMVRRHRGKKRERGTREKEEEETSTCSWTEKQKSDDEGKEKVKKSERSDGLNEVRTEMKRRGEIEGNEGEDEMPSR